MNTKDTNVSQKQNEKENRPPAPPIKEKEKEKETLPPFSCENGPTPAATEQLRQTMAGLLAKFAVGTITESELSRLRTQKRNGNLARLGFRWNDPAEEKNETSEFSAVSEKKPEASSQKERGSHFVRPTLEEVQHYVAEKNLNVDPDEFFDHFTSNGWKVGGKAPMKSWQAAVNNWHRRENKRFATRAPTTTTTEEAEEWKRMASTPESIDLSDLTS